MSKVLDGHARFLILIVQHQPLLGELFDCFLVFIQVRLPGFKLAGNFAFHSPKILAQKRKLLAQFRLILGDCLNPGLRFQNVVRLG